MAEDQTNIASSNDTPKTRRGFFRTAGASAGALAGLASLPAVHAQGKSQIRVGLVGCGGRGTGAAVNAMTADPAVRITAMADLFDQSIASCRKSLEPKFKEQLLVDDDRCFTGFDSYKELMNSDVEVVLLASPPHYRPDHIEEAVRTGKQVFCEKPVAVDPVGVRRVEAACKRADDKGLNIVSGLCWRYDKGMGQTVQRIADGAIGDIVTTQCNFLTNPTWMKVRKPGESEMEYQCRNWYNYVWLSGDHIVEQHVHSLDKALWLRDDVPPVKAYGLAGRQLRDPELQGNIYDHFSIVFEWADGTRTYANARQMRNCMNEVEDFVFGTRGNARLVKHVIDGEEPWRFEGKEVQMHQAEQDEFFKAVQGKRPRINNGTYMCRSTMMAILGREAGYTGKELTYQEVANSDLDLRPRAYQWGDAPPVEIRQPGVYKFGA